MGQGFGREIPSGHVHHDMRQVARYLVLIGSGDVELAKLYTADRAPAGEFDAGTEEVAVMVKGLQANTGASGAEWDQALAGHSGDERAAATVYVLDV